MELTALSPDVGHREFEVDSRAPSHPIMCALAGRSEPATGFRNGSMFHGRFGGGGFAKLPPPGNTGARRGSCPVLSWLDRPYRL